MALFKAFRGSRASLDAVEKHDGYAYFCTDDGSFHIDFVDADGNLQRKQISAGEAEKLTGYSISTSLLYGSDTQIPTTRAVKNSLNSLQRKIVHADLATNDSSKRSYVKNRTHWIEYEKGEELVSFSFNAETSYVNGYRALSYDEEAEAAIALLKTLLIEGTMYIVVHNNIEYECVVSHGFMSDEIYLGNMWISSSAKEDTEEQFLIRPNENGYGHFVSIGAGIQSIAIYAANEIIHPLDEKFLPDVAVTQDDISGFAPIDSPEFLNSISLGRKADSTVGSSSVALGSNVEASGYNAVAIGSGAVASGPFAIALGNGTTASQYCAYAEGDHSVASGAMSHAENGATAKGTSSHAEGCSTTQGSYAHAEGYQTQAIGNITHTEGWQTEAYGENSHAEGSLTVTQGGNSHAEGYGTITQGMAQHVQGKYNTKEIFYENRVTETGTFGFATYYSSDGYTFDELTGKFTLTDATTVSYPEYSTTKYFSQGVNPTITIFKFTEITSEESVNEKTGTYERITSYMENDYAHVLGNGTDDENRSNAHTIDWNGNAWFQGEVYIGGTGQDDASAKKLITDADIQQSDWDQTDETATDYVKNRPCGRYAAKEVYSGIVTGFTSLSYATTPTWSAIVPTGVGIPEYGQVYDVTIDGITYRGATVQETTFAEHAIGTTEVYYYPNEQHPYTIIFRENEFEVHVQIEGDSHTIEFNRVGSIKKLSMEFLPDELITEGELKKTRSNWAQNDSTALDYVHNRTHYDAEVSNIIADEQEVTYTYDSSLNYSTPTSHGKVTTVSDTRLVVGNAYVITIDGVEYVATAQSGSDSMAGQCPFLFVDCDGVLGYFINELRDNENYGCIAVEVYNAIQKTNVTTTFTIKIEEKTTTVIPLPERFIPDTIARTSDINTQMEAVNNHIADTTNPHKVTAEQVGIYIGSDKPTDSNIKVWINISDEVTGAIPVLPRITTINLLADNWTGSSEPYSQVVEVNTVTSATKIDLQPTAHQIVELQNAEISLMVENNGGVVTCYAIGNKPTVDYTMQVLLQEVSYV